MPRCTGRHAKSSSRYEGRHAKPGTPVPAGLVGTAAKAVPVSLAAGAGSALVLSGTAFAATTTPASTAHIGTADLAPSKATAGGTWATQGRHAAPRTVYTVTSGDTLSDISARFCGTPHDFQALAAASGITDPDMIFPGESIKLSCHATSTTASSGAGSASAPSGGGSSSPAPAKPKAPSTGTTGTSGMSAFESCVISSESGGNPQAVNPVSGAGGLFQFLPSTWAALGYASAYPGGAQTAPVSVQEAAFNKLFAEDGTAPWAPFDGC